jgi:hypothetical protein
MSIKNLSFPIFMAVALFIGFFLVKPTVESILSQRADLDAKTAENIAVEATVQNLDSLFASKAALLDTEEGKAVYEYLPASVSQDRIVDTFNYYATQTGVSINGITFTEKVAPPTSDVSDPASSSGSTTVLVATPSAPVPHSFTMNAAVQGTYENIRAFLKGISNPRRSYSLTSFSISKKEAVSVDPSGQLNTSAGILSGKFSAEFYYLPLEKYRNGYMLPLFASKEFNVDPIREIIAKEGAIPSLANPDSVGRGNPFGL